MRTGIREPCVKNHFPAGIDSTYPNPSLAIFEIIARTVFAMTEWYYTRGGQQAGPVSFEQLGELARNGNLDPQKDLVWTAAMKDWTPSGQVPGLFATPASPTAPAGDPANPYAAPATSWTEAASVSAGEALEEIVHGSELIDVTACVKRGFDLTVRNFGMIALVGVVFIAVTFASKMVLTVMDHVLGLTPISFLSEPAGFQPPSGFGPGAPPESLPPAFPTRRTNAQTQGSPLNIILSQLLSIFLTVGATRIGLNLVSGREISVGMLFAGGKKFLPALGASILYGLMVFVGFILLVVPGIYLALRYGQFMVAIVDKDMGVMESLKYSSSLTTNNRLNLLLLGLLHFLVMVAGCLALCVGTLFALPVVWLSAIVAYRWLQYGPRAAMDHPGTTTPMLAGR